MALFQTSVLKKYLPQQDHAKVEKAYKAYSKYFLNLEIQENIHSSKEEQFQATFLTELFVKIFGYTINPSTKYNLTTEYKNEKNNRKADGPILNNGKTIAVIELKGTNTKDLESIRRQAFDYKVNHKEWDQDKNLGINVSLQEKHLELGHRISPLFFTRRHISIF